MNEDREGLASHEGDGPEEGCALHVVTGEAHTAYLSGDGFSRTPVAYIVVDGLAVMEGDIVLGDADRIAREAEEVERFLAAATAGEQVEFAPLGSVITGSRYRWPNATVPIVFDGLPNPERVERAINHWHERTTVRFVRRTTERNWIRVVRSDKCSSWVGMQGGEQRIQLADGCGWAAAAHEFGHAFGLYHEQSRRDRDRHVVIHWSNIQSGAASNFRIAGLGSDVGTYDFDSLMHYGAYAFSSNGRPTITTIPPGIPIGQRRGLSQGDVRTIQSLVQRSVDENAMAAWMGRVAADAPETAGAPDALEIDGAEVMSEANWLLEAPSRDGVAWVFPDIEGGQIYLNLFNQAANVELRGRWRDGNDGYVSVKGDPAKPQHHAALHMAMFFAITFTDIHGRVLSHRQYVVTGDYTRFHLPSQPMGHCLLRVWANDHAGRYRDNSLDPADPARIIYRTLP